VTLAAVMMGAAIPAVLVRDAYLSITIISVAMCGCTWGSANMTALPADVTPAQLVGSVYGLASMRSGFGGMLFALITGWILDHYSYVPVFIGFGIMPMIYVLILWTLMGPLRPMTEFS